MRAYTRRLSAMPWKKPSGTPPAGQTDTDVVAVIEPNHAVCHQDPPARWHGGLEDEVLSSWGHAKARP
jgi:hypothetical protein